MNIYEYIYIYIYIIYIYVYIYMLSHIIYHIHQLTIIFALTIKAVVFLQCVMVISKIKYDFFLIGIFYYFRLKILLFHV